MSGAVVCAVLMCAPARPAADPTSRQLVVDCLLPGQVRKLGGQMTYLSPRRPIKATGEECEVLGGEYVAYDRANAQTALGIWMQGAANGDAEAMAYVGVIYEKGLGQAPDYVKAAEWYQKAADAGSSRAMSNLAYLYEEGLGVEQDETKSLNLYRQAAGIKGNDLIFQADADAALRAAQDQIDRLTVRLEARNAQIKRLSDSLASTQYELSGRKSALAKSQEEARSLRAQLQQAQRQNVTPERLASLQKLERDLETREVAIQRQLKEIADIESADTQRRTQVAALEAEGKANSEQIAQLRQQASAAPNTQLAMRSGSPASSSPAKPRRVPANLDLGEFHALLIGNDRYESMPNLETAVNDVQAVSRVLTRRYGFATRVLTNATRDQILDALNEYRLKLKEKDNLLVYYAGHGELDRQNLRGYWLPVDARRDSNTRWISDQMVTDQIGLMAARHVLVVADSRYSGVMTRSSGVRLLANGGDSAEMKRLVTLAKLPSRTVLTSGGENPVLDTGGGANSIFARALIDALDKNQDVLEGTVLYGAIFDPVKQAAARFKVDQSPRYAVLADTRHRNGEFLFIPRLQ
jgi:hypothetical protein